MRHPRVLAGASPYKILSDSKPAARRAYTLQSDRSNAESHRDRGLPKARFGRDIDGARDF
jgi:hypothetical protein